MSEENNPKKTEQVEEPVEDQEQECRLTRAGKIKKFINDNALILILMLVVVYLCCNDEDSKRTPVLTSTTTTETAPGAQGAPRAQLGGVIRLDNNILGTNYNEPGYTTTPVGLSRYM